MTASQDMVTVRATTRVYVGADGFEIWRGLRTSDMSAVGLLGELSGVKEGQTYEVDGEESSHPRFGAQIKVRTWRLRTPITGAAVMSLLRQMDGWGDTRARAAWATYGERTLDALRQEPVEKIQADVAAKADVRIPTDAIAVLREEMEENEQRHGLWVEVRARIKIEHGADRITKAAIRKWEDQAPSILDANPWRLAELPGVGFPTADLAALASGRARDCAERILAGLGHAMESMAWGGNVGDEWVRGGSTIHLRSDVVRAAVALLAIRPADLIEERVDQLIETEEWVSSTINGKEWVTDAATADAEREVAERLVRRAIAAKSMPPVSEADVGARNSGLKSDQIRALSAALSHQQVAIVGAPGTGKTHTLRYILAELSDLGEPTLCAPTGKAAKRMMDLTGQRALTIHKTLGAVPNERAPNGFSFEHDEHNPLPTKLVVVDEFSMVDLSLFRSLLRALPDSCRLVLVGDRHQLPSVGPGALLRDLQATDVMPIVELTEIKRQDPGLIVTNCHRVKGGKPPEFPAAKEGEKIDTYFVEVHDTADAAATIVDLVVNRLRVVDAAKDDPVASIQVLTPLRERGGLAAKPINEAVSAARRASGEVVPHKGFKFGVGEKVICTKNLYSSGCLNGDVGVVKECVYEESSAPSHYRIDFGYPSLTELPVTTVNLEMAYAITVHKSQGSEWPVVVLPMHPSLGLFPDRTLLYTAMSRASKLLVLVGRRGEASEWTKRVVPDSRTTDLVRQVRNAIARMNDGAPTR